MVDQQLHLHGYGLHHVAEQTAEPFLRKERNRSTGGYMKSAIYAVYAASVAVLLAAPQVSSHPFDYVEFDAETYEEVEGILPDTDHTLIERRPCNHRPRDYVAKWAARADHRVVRVYANRLMGRPTALVEMPDGWIIWEYRPPGDVPGQRIGMWCVVLMGTR